VVVVLEDRKPAERLRDHLSQAQPCPKELVAVGGQAKNVDDAISQLNPAIRPRKPPAGNGALVDAVCFFGLAGLMFSLITNLAHLASPAPFVTLIGGMLGNGSAGMAATPCASVSPRR